MRVSRSIWWPQWCHGHNEPYGYAVLHLFWLHDKQLEPWKGQIAWVLYTRPEWLSRYQVMCYCSKLTHCDLVISSICSSLCPPVWLFVLIIFYQSTSKNVINSLWPCPSVARWWHRCESILTQVIACCLMAPSHYLSQCWLIISGVSFTSNFARNSICKISLYNILLELPLHLPEDSELRTSHLHLAWVVRALAITYTFQNHHRYHWYHNNW